MNTIGLLGVAFVVLKLDGVIAWPWIWVTAPFWVGMIAYLLLLLIATAAYVWRRRNGLVRFRSKK